MSANLTLDNNDPKSQLDLAKEDQDVELAFRAFKQSYDVPDVKIAYLYRVEDRDKLYNAELENINKTLEKDKKILEELMGILKSKGIQNLKDQPPIIKLLKEVDLVNIPDKKEIIDGFLVILQEEEKWEMEDIDAILGSINYERATMRAEKILFNSEYPDNSGVWYELINGTHTWLNNVCWMFGHFMKGTNKFIIRMNKLRDEGIIGMFSENNMYRKNSSESAGRFGSGFIREVYCCVLNEFILREEGDEIILYLEQPSFSSQKLPKLIFNPMPDHSQPMFEKYVKTMESYYQLLKPSVKKELNDIIKFHANSSDLYDIIIGYDIFPELPEKIREGSIVPSFIPKVSESLIEKLFAKIMSEIERREQSVSNSAGKLYANK